MEKFEYFVSYSFERGFGNCQIISSKLITTYEDIKSIEQKINCRQNITGAIVLYYQLMK